VIGHNFVVTVHPEPLPFLDQLRERERGDTQLGVLSAESFTVSLLDWQLTTYADAVAELEAEIDRLEVQMLTGRALGEHLPEMAQLRRAASRLRRLLVPHRAVFGAMARPDFRPDPDGVNDKQFRGLNERFERSLDAVENARELVIGSFELFATRTAQRTNETMRVLTFVTVLLGSLSVLAGVLGMNFEAPFFHSGQKGFVITIVAMLVIAALALVVARWRRWL
jgi:Mg2+ and Co2+ transporter CorA